MLHQHDNAPCRTGYGWCGTRRRRWWRPDQTGVVKQDKIRPPNQAVVDSPHLLMDTVLHPFWLRPDTERTLAEVLRAQATCTLNCLHGFAALLVERAALLCDFLRMLLKIFRGNIHRLAAFFFHFRGLRLPSLQMLAYLLIKFWK